VVEELVEQVQQDVEQQVQPTLAAVVVDQEIHLEQEQVKQVDQE
jgi:hypothetical protein